MNSLNLSTPMLDDSSGLIGNPITLLIERICYLGIGIFFIAALYTGLRRGNQDN